MGAVIMPHTDVLHRKEKLHVVNPCEETERQKRRASMIEYVIFHDSDTEEGWQDRSAFDARIEAAVVKLKKLAMRQKPRLWLGRAIQAADAVDGLPPPFYSQIPAGVGVGKDLASPHCSIKALPLRSDEARMVRTMLLSDLPHAVLVGIEKVDHEIHNMRFGCQKHILAVSGKSDATEFLWHGSRAMPPTEIAMSHAGLGTYACACANIHVLTYTTTDMRVASRGDLAFGPGIYLATCSDYSARFAHVVQNHEIIAEAVRVVDGHGFHTAPETTEWCVVQLMLVECLPGKVQDMGSTTRVDMRRPDDEFDSVCAVTKLGGGTTMRVFYNNGDVRIVNVVTFALPTSM